MRLRFWHWIFAILWILIPPGAEAASLRPVITRLDTQFLDNNVNINVHWDSPNPVVLVKVLVGAEQKEIKVDEYDNKRKPRGYTGEATVVLNVQPRPGLDFVNYVIYLEDDLRQKSEQKSGRAKVPTTAMAQMPGMQPGMPSVQVGVQVGVQPGAMPPMGMPGGYGPQPGIDPNQPGMQPGYPGAQPGQQMGTPGGYGPQPGIDPNQPGMQPGYPGAQPGQQMGMPMGPATGYPSGSQPGMQSGYPGAQPGQQMGMPGGYGPQPGIDPNQPGMQPGYPGAQPGQQAGYQFGTSPGGAMGGQPSGPSGMINLTPSQGGTTGAILGVISQVDVPPYFSDIKVNLFQGSNVTISGNVIDDKGLREISFRIFDTAGNKVQEQTITNQGRVWQGTTNPFTLPTGRYRVIAQAIDLGGNSSKERTADFEITGQGQVLQTPSPAPPMTPEQAQAFSATASASSPQATSPDQQGAMGQPGPGQQITPGKP